MPMATFYELAMIGVENGIQVIPCLPKEKRCILEDWPSHATTDLSQFKKWNDQDPSYNVAYAAKLEVGTPTFLEFDVPCGMLLAAELMGHPVPKTRVDKSGKGFGHWIFTHTERSIQLGNRQARDKKTGGEWFSFRADRRYIVGAGSIHPNGNTYNVVNDIKPQPIPDWVCDFIDKYTIPEAKKKKGGGFPRGQCT